MENYYNAFQSIVKQMRIETLKLSSYYNNVMSELCPSFQNNTECQFNFERGFIRYLNVFHDRIKNACFHIPSLLHSKIAIIFLCKKKGP